MIHWQRTTLPFAVVVVIVVVIVVVVVVVVVVTFVVVVADIVVIVVVVVHRNPGPSVIIQKKYVALKTNHSIDLNHDTGRSNLIEKEERSNSFILMDEVVPNPSDSWRSGHSARCFGPS